MYFNDVASFYERSPYVFQGQLTSVRTLNLLLPRRSEIRVVCSAGSSLVVTGFDGVEPVNVGFDLLPNDIVQSGFMFSYISSLSSNDFEGEVQIINHDGSPVLIESLIATIPVAVSQTLPSRRTASILRLDTEGANPNDFFVVSWPLVPGVTITQDVWVELERLNLKGVLQEVTLLTNASTGVFFQSGYVKVSTDEI